jgi:hypothetical protein
VAGAEHPDVVPEHFVFSYGDIDEHIPEVAVIATLQNVGNPIDAVSDAITQAGGSLT